MGIAMMQGKHIMLVDHNVHYLEGGEGFPILIIHGVGPGTSAMANFGTVLEPLSAGFHIFAMDLIGFGASQRRKQQPYFDFDLWVEQGLAMIEQMPAGPVGVIGHSMGGAMALAIASRSDRVVKVMTSCAVGAPYAITPTLNSFWSVPKDRDSLRETIGQTMYSPSLVTDQMVSDRWQYLNTEGYPEYIAELFSEPRQRFLDAATLSDATLATIKAKVVMLHGRDDRPCPPELTTSVVSSKLPEADVHLLSRCGHNLPRERTADFLHYANALFGAA